MFQDCISVRASGDGECSSVCRSIGSGHESMQVTVVELQQLLGMALRIRRLAHRFGIPLLLTFDVPPTTPEKVIMETMDAHEYREEPLLSKDDNTYDSMILAQIYARGRFFIDEEFITSCMQDLDRHVASACLREHTPKSFIGPNFIQMPALRQSGWQPVVIVHYVETAMAEIFLKMISTEPHFASVSSRDEKSLLSALYGLVAILTTYIFRDNKLQWRQTFIHFVQRGEAASTCAVYSLYVSALLCREAIVDTYFSEALVNHIKLSLEQADGLEDSSCKY